jgi:hypothetical protein
LRCAPSSRPSSSAAWREGRGSRAHEAAAKRLGELHRSDNLQTARWADDVLKRNTVAFSSTHLVDEPRNADVRDQEQDR